MISIGKVQAPLVFVVFFDEPGKLRPANTRKLNVPDKRTRSKFLEIGRYDTHGCS